MDGIGLAPLTSHPGPEEDPSVALAAWSRAVEDRIRNTWRRDQRPKSAPTSHWASRAGHPCAWHLWAHRTRWAEIPAPSLDLLGVFAAGNEGERSITRELDDAGFHLVQQQVGFRDDGLDVSGRIDGYLLDGSILDLYRSTVGEEPPPRWPGIPVEIKTVSTHYWDELTSLDAMLNSSRPWVRMWPLQLILYCYLAPDEHPLAALVMRDKNTRQPRVLAFRVEDYFYLLERAGEVLAAVNVALREGTEPEPIAYDPLWCQSCDVEHLCPVAMHIKGGGSISLEAGPVAERLRLALDEKTANHEAHRAYERADGQVKKLLGETGHWPAEPGAFECVVCGPYAVDISVTSAKTAVPSACRACGAAIVKEPAPRRSVEVRRLGGDS